MTHVWVCRHPAALLVLALSLAACTAPPRYAAATHDCRIITARTYRVVRIIDGDTFTITYDGEETSVRIAGIDAPERDEPGAKAAHDAPADLIDGRVVLIKFTERSKRDSFGRLLCRVKVDVVDVGEAMLGRGLVERW